MTRFLQIAVGLFAAMSLAGCGLPAGNMLAFLPTPATGPTAHSPHLEAALAHAPVATENIAFTDWTVLKEVAGVPTLTSADSRDDRIKFMLALGVEQQAVASVYGRSTFFTHAEEWGWDSTDLFWEATLSVGNGPPIYLLRFRDDFDFSPVLDRFEERGFTRREHAGVPLYSHEMDLQTEWQRTTEFAILNTAFLEEEKLFVLSSSPGGVTAVLDTLTDGPTLANLPSVRSVAAALGEVGAAVLLPVGCQQFDVAALLGETADTEQIAERMAELGQTGVYSGFGLGYRPGIVDGETDPLGVVVLHYLDPAQAAADLTPRRQLAETGTSLEWNAPYAELFEVVDARVQRSNLVLSLRARERPPHLFIQMFYERDLLFAVCGGS